ncbi:CGNR zinc finger domain-containing protein [Haloactinomyces albus]|uniref:Zinc finger CGNR domain-containing protein n=1 Tax=Haloactinomyces albus TaxID=1352928 RepID=A0AAE4CLJ2_9ACTN|nr:CGNR zinc finger domain-containing protein [Haloactinomyces albus]MDR7302320.1 hypothetical protein [Haloactinomyces albus]
MSTEATGSDSAVAPGKAGAAEHRAPSAARESAGLDTEHDIELVLAFLNTCDSETGTELLDDPVGWQQWCLERGLGRAPESTAARKVRDSLRTAVSCGGGPPRSELPADITETPGLPGWPVRVRIQGGVPVLTGTDALGSVLAAAARLVTTGHWDRLKICPAENCLWTFYDRSRNRSRTWCSMRVCGNREKARSWRERRTAT